VISSTVDPDGSSEDLPHGYWPADQVRAILEATLVTETAPIPSGLSSAERETVRRLVAAARILDDVFQDQFHHQAISSRNDLRALHEALRQGPRTTDLLDLQELWQGPIVTSLENERLPFLPVDGEQPGRNLYPRGTRREAIDSFLADHPDERASILHPYTVVRSTTKASLAETSPYCGATQAWHSCIRPLSRNGRRCSPTPLGWRSTPFPFRSPGPTS
jgi:hypothetical protein